MATIDVTQVGEFIIKNGAKAVLLVWVATQQLQINEIRNDYRDCMNNRIEDNRMRYPIQGRVAVLPRPISLKQWEGKQQKKS